MQTGETKAVPPVHTFSFQNDEVRQDFDRVYKLAKEKGGESFESWQHCTRTLRGLKASIHYDFAENSFGFAGRGMVGGLIYHASEDSWSCHT